MEIKELRKYLHKYLRANGFEKIKSKYYLKSDDFLCMIHFYSSYYSQSMYFDYYFFIGNFSKPYEINQDNAETYTPYVGSRFYFTEVDTYSCDYPKYSETQLFEHLEENFKKRIRPPFE